MKKLLQPFLNLLFLLKRPLTVGVRGVIIDKKTNSVLMVRHTYSEGWYFPGGGVEIGETVEQGLIRELKEEAGINVVDFCIDNIYLNSTVSSRDHVVTFIVKEWTKICSHSLPNAEIAEVKWQSLDLIPTNLSPCTVNFLKSAKIPIANSCYKT